VCVNAYVCVYVCVDVDEWMCVFNDQSTFLVHNERRKV
jgi:hypothetical protein